MFIVCKPLFDGEKYYKDSLLVQDTMDMSLEWVDRETLRQQVNMRGRFYYYLGDERVAGYSFVKDQYIYTTGAVSYCCGNRASKVDRVDNYEDGALLAYSAFDWKAGSLRFSLTRANSYTSSFFLNSNSLKESIFLSGYDTIYLHYVIDYLDFKIGVFHVEKSTLHLKFYIAFKDDKILSVWDDGLGCLYGDKSIAMRVQMVPPKY